jgi:chromosome segregation protein
LYLKSLTLRGFKTFADKTTVEFNPAGGIIAVVGPNGCGKSNIVDSIRWVLGEQSLREIRSSAMEDIIFAGTAARKPLSMAEVTLEIDNSDKFFHSEYTEVSIKRRVFRSGDSEFSINKNPCRLKDIKDLFLDTGLGKGAYSLINQGKVDAILSSKPEERRAPFEEAAQISKYRFRKEAAERKLIATEQNLLRINDLRSELSSQIKVLEEQAGKARKYKEIRTVLKELEIGLTKKQLQSLNERRSSQSGRIDQLRTELFAAQNRFGEIESGRQSIRDEIKAKELDIESAIASIEGNLSNISKAKMGVEIEQERERSLCEQMELNRKETEDLKPRLDEYRKKLADKGSQRGSLQALLEAKERDLAELKAVLDAETSREEALQKSIDDLKSSVFASESALADERNKLIELDGNERFAKEELSRDQRSIAKLEKELNAAESALKEIRSSRSAEESRLEKLDSSIDERARARKEIEAGLLENERELSALKDEINAKSSKLSVLQSMMDEYKGFGEGVKEVLKLTKQSGKNYGIVGVVADLISVDEKHELAVETALGQNIQVIVTRSDGSARELIDHLRKENLGKATFLPLNLLRQSDKMNAAEFAGQPGFIGIASSLVKCDQAVSQAIDFLLGGTVVFDSLEHALKLYKTNKLPRGSRIVTLSGELITFGGMISGGAPLRRAAAHLGRERELISLSSEIDQLKTKGENASGAVAELKERINGIESEIVGQSQTKNKALLLLANVKHDEDSRAESIRNFKEELSLLRDSSAARKSETEDIEKCKADISRRIAELEAGKIKDDAALKEHLSGSKARALSMGELTGRITECRIETSRLTHQMRAFEEEIAITNENIARIEETLRYKESLDLGTKLGASRAMIATLKEELPKLETGQGDLESTLKAKKEEKARLSEKIESFEKQTQDAAEAERSLREKLSREEVSSAKIEAEMNMISQNIVEDYGLTIEEIIASPFEVPNQAKARDEVKILKDEFKSLGDVNLLAIEEFERTRDRLAFLENQVADLEQARENLRSLIVQLDQKARESFIETIRVVSENFSKIFADLFDGGEAKIMLIEGDDILDAGIEIVARPGGKKWLSLDLLSGGEKALTAIAILFSLLRTHPSPFCFLDEVDAALDDSNVVRFGKMLRRFSDDTQMIVITHSKRTMEAANILYGVTMEEPGVSKLVSMKLAEVPQNLQQ